LTNAGIPGSNFCIDGTIETDACIITMNGSGAVGAVPMTGNGKDFEIHQHPISIAKKVYEKQEKGPDKIGRIPPILMVGESAHCFAKESGLPMISAMDASKKVTEAQNATYKSHLGILKLSKDLDQFQDTVGAIAVDSQGNISAGVSSGGISLKSPGRVGEAALAGSGVWVYQDDNISIGCSISGTGEQIMKTMLASTLTNSLLHDLENLPQTIEASFRKCFLENKVLHKEVLKFAGVLFLVKIGEHIETWWIHSTESFCIGTISNSRQSFEISRKKADAAFCIKGSC
jgi:taspase (threonine aspartase 1)